jgi:SAM-dependent methyltransferase
LPTPPVSAPLTKLLRSLREHGAHESFTLVGKNLRAVTNRYLNRHWDRRFHVDTTGIVLLEALTCSGDKAPGIWYEPTPVRTLEHIFRFLPNKPADFTFVDFGSGKGRALLYASRFPFKRIVGVEFAKELHSIAERNIQTFRSSRQRCFDIRSVCMDAGEFEIPEGDCVLYFFHPFWSEVMARVLCNMERSYRAHPRTFLVLYYHPLSSKVFEQAAFLRKRAEAPTPFDLTAEPCPYRRRLAVYDSV